MIGDDADLTTDEPTRSAELMNPGIFENVFDRPTMDETFAAVAGAGFQAVQAHLPTAGVDPWADGAIDPARIEAFGRAAASHQVRLAALDGAFNMAHPDPLERARGLQGLTRVIDAAAQLGVPFVTLCTGTRDTTSMWRWHPENGSPEAWLDAVDTVSRAVEVAERRGITLLVEPEPANVARSAERSRRLLDEISSPRLKIVIDPANMVLSDRSRDPGDVLEAGMALLADDIAFAHAKDLDEQDRFCAAGTGIVPWDRYRELLMDIGYVGDVIYHTLTEADVPKARAVMGWS